MGRKSLGERLIICNQCNQEYIYNRSNRKGGTSKTCNKCLVGNRRRTIKDMAIAYKGGKCKICGYSTSKRALSFHHIDPSTKEFGIAYAGVTRSWDRTKKELDKCILLCANCHMEVEDGLITLDTSVP